MYPVNHKLNIFNKHKDEQSLDMITNCDFSYDVLFVWFILSALLIVIGSIMLIQKSVPKTNQH